MPDGGQFVGVGVFTVPEAARLLRMPPRQVSRLVFGYDDVPPASIPELPSQDGQDALGFLNLIETLFFRELHAQGVSWQAVRKAADIARRILPDAPHPFANRRLHTDGKGVFLETRDETHDAGLIDLLDGNGAMLKVLERSFTKSIRFDEVDGRADRWTPDPDLPRVVVDPARSFGRPIDETGVPVEVLADALRAEGGNAEKVARWWDVPVEAVRQAGAFQARFYGRRRAA